MAARSASEQSPALALREVLRHGWRRGQTPPCAVRQKRERRAARYLQGCSTKARTAAARSRDQGSCRRNQLNLEARAVPRDDWGINTRAYSSSARASNSPAKPLPCECSLISRAISRVRVQGSVMSAPVTGYLLNDYHFGVVVHLASHVDGTSSRTDSWRCSRHGVRLHRREGDRAFATQPPSWRVECLREDFDQAQP